MNRAGFRFLTVAVLVSGFLIAPSLRAQSQPAPPDATTQAQQPGEAQGQEPSQAQTPQPGEAQGQEPGQAQGAPAQEAHYAEKQAAERQALGFMQYLDQGRYADSYAYTSALLRAQSSKEHFGRSIQTVRASDGAEKSRKLIDATYTTTLPQAPQGQYIVLQFATDFADKQDAVETLTMSLENGYWRVAGYFVR